MTRHSLVLAFDDFGWQALEDEARAEGWELGELLAIACRYYVRELDRDGRVELSAPDWKPPERGSVRELELDLPDESWRTLDREADLQGISLERLVAHAALLFLADADRGRAVRRLAEDESGSEGPTGP